LNGAPGTLYPEQFFNPSPRTPRRQEDYAIELARALQHDLRTQRPTSELERTVFEMADYAIEQAIAEANNKNNQFHITPPNTYTYEKETHKFTMPSSHHQAGEFNIPNAALTCRDQGCSVFVRSGPSTDTSEVCTGSNGFGVTANHTQGQWVNITSNSGCSGWVREDLVQMY